MKTILRKGFQEYEFFTWRDVRFMTFRDRTEAAAFLNDFSTDPESMAFLRRLLDRASVLKSVRGLSDSEVIDAAAEMMVAERIRVLMRYDVVQPSALAGEFFKGDEVPPPSEPAEPGETEPATAEDTVTEAALPPDEPVPESVAAQAEALESAAESGTALCEA